MPSRQTKQVSSASPAEAFLAATRRYLKLPKEGEQRGEALEEFQRECRTLYQALLVSSDAEDPEGWFALGHGAGHGWGTEWNLEESERWFRKAAEAGHTDAMVRLGMRLRHPERGDDWEEAVSWHRRAADAGNSSGMVSLGFACREGQGVPVDYEAAADWFIKAYEAGDEHACIHAARMFQSYLNRANEAIDWYQRGADADQSEAYIGLASLYDDRNSGCFDPAEAVKWYQIAVAKKGAGVAHSLLSLAHHYRNGDGVPRSSEIARCWLERLFSETSPQIRAHREGLKLRAELDSDLL